MPRLVDINTKEFMEPLMHHFWVKGYSATNIDDLVGITGLSKSYIYTNFGKKGLFEEAFYYYLDNYTDPFLEALNQDRRGIAAIREKLNFLVDSLINNSMPKACLFVNTVVEIGDKDRDICDLNDGYVKRVTARYAEKLRYCQEQGEIAPTANIPLYTSILVNLLFSLAVLYKTHSREELDEIIGSVLAMMR